MRLKPAVLAFAAAFLLIALILPAFFSGAQPGSSSWIGLGAAQSTVIEIDPIIVPPVDPLEPDLCETQWYTYKSEDIDVYLTLNAHDEEDASNSGVWAPIFSKSEEGIYLVEAYIPEHEEIAWECPEILIPANSHTANAVYQITHATGESEVTIDQSASSGGWVELGIYSFYAGSGGYIELTDITGEESHTTTVVFTTIRFTRLSPLSKLYLPYISHLLDPVQFNTAYSARADAVAWMAFKPGDSIRLYGTGVNQTGNSAPAHFTWTVSGPCGTNTLFSGTLLLNSGSWSLYQPFTAPTCLGEYSLTITMVYESKTITRKREFAVNNPSDLGLTTMPSFDKCEIPTIEQMQTWWKESPYSAINLYVGGIARSCANSDLTAVWISRAARQGWTFIPTWVGPQAPCSRFRHRMSSDPLVAYQQGRSEAGAAYLATARLGLETSIIYYDIEAFSGASDSCRYTVQRFLSGWTERLHELGVRSGGYGAPCSSYMADWTKTDVMVPPDDVWIAAWNRTYYDPDATVWNTACLPNSAWPDFQRIRQYAGDHYETWGGVTMVIDSNAMLSRVTYIPLGYYSQSAIQGPAAPPSSPDLKEARLLNDQEGWAISGDSLLWTDDGGENWQDITPLEVEPDSLLAVHYNSQGQGWMARLDPQTQSVQVRQAHDSGAWQTLIIPGVTPNPDGLGSDPAAQSAYFHFIDPHTGWLALKLPSGSNFSLGALFHTSDGGQTWQPRQLPIGAPVTFIDSLQGWTAGGPQGDELYRTRDGGFTWERQSPAGQDSSERIFYGLPAFESVERGWLPVTVAAGVNSRFEVYATQNGGQTWQLAGVYALDGANPPAAPLPASFAGGRWWAAGIDTHSTPVLFSAEAGDGRFSTLQPTGLPDGVVELNFSDGGHGWARVITGGCSGYKPRLGEIPPADAEPFACHMDSVLLYTSDGGQTWTGITP